MNRTLIYARVSTEDQTEKYGIPLQLAACRERAKRDGLIILEEITDDGISGTILSRPGLDRVRAKIAAGEADLVLCYDVDRLSRELADLLVLQREIQTHGRMEFVLAAFDQSPIGQLFFSIRGAFAQFERCQFLERSMRGKRERARSGLIVGGRIAYGYVYDGGRIVADLERAKTIISVFEWYDAGASIRAITLRLRSLGVPTWGGKRWGHSSVRRILVNETYAGMAYHGTHKRDGKRLTLRNPIERIAIPVPAIVPRELWDRVQRRLAANPCNGRPSSRYLLRGLLHCGACGRRMTGNSRRGHTTYRCNGRDASRHQGAPCKLCVNARRIDTTVWEAILSRFTNVDFLRSVLSEHERALRADEELEAPESKLQGLRAQVAKLKRRESAAVLSLTDADLMDARPALKQKYREIRAELLRVESAIASIEQSARVVAIGADWLKETVELLRGYIPTLESPEQRQEFVREVISRAEWAGDEVRLHCFIGAKAGSMHSSSDQFRSLAFTIVAKVAA